MRPALIRSYADTAAGGVTHFDLEVNKLVRNCEKTLQVRKASRCSLLAAAIAIIVSSGCGSSNSPHTVPVKGKVSYNGQPLKSGTVMLVPEESGYGATGQIQSDGTFILTSFKQGDGAAPGNYKVTVQVFPDEEDATSELGLPGAEFGMGKKPPIPMEYMDPATTKLTALINDGETELDLKLED